MKIYKEQNVYEATQERLKFIFNEFEYIYVSFSGGKDSGLLLNLVIDFMRENNYNKKIGLFHSDVECQYTHTTSYVERTFNNFIEIVEPFWFCNEILRKNDYSNISPYWVCWERELKDKWVRELPNYDYVITNENAKLKNFSYIKHKMQYRDNFKKFSEHYANLKNSNKVVCLVGLRSDESLQRYSAVSRNAGYKDKEWVTKNKNSYTAYPIYDWRVSDLWRCNYEFNYDYNKTYDYFTNLGVLPEKQRIGAPFNLKSKKEIDLFKKIDPKIWDKFLDRVVGINSNSLDAESVIKNKKNEKEYALFLLKTIGKSASTIYLNKIDFSVNDKDYWKNVVKSIINCDFKLGYVKRFQEKQINENQKKAKKDTINKWI